MQSPLPQTMRCIMISPEQSLLMCEKSVPKPYRSQILIEVRAAGLNRADILQRKGLYPPPEGASSLPGLEVAGIVCGLGSDVKGFEIGMEVCALLTGGGYAEYAVADSETCLPKPLNLSWEEAAGLPEAAFTVWNNVFYRGGLKEDETLLVHGGSSGIGSLAIQMAKQLGSVVAATTSSDERNQHCHKLGASHTASYIDKDWAATLKDATGGVDVILDVAGGSMLEGNIDLLNLDGRLVTIAYMGGQHGKLDFTKLMRKRLTVTGSTLRGRPLHEQEILRDALLRHIWPLIEKGTIKPVIDKVFPLEKAQDAHIYMESGQHFGKIILMPDSNIV